MNWIFNGNRRTLLLTSAAVCIAWQTLPLNTVRAQTPQDLVKQERLFNSIEWQQGPIDVPLGSAAQIHVPEGFRFTGTAGTRTWLELTENPSNVSYLGVLAPDSWDWFLLFAHDDIGYVRDDEQDSLDADAILQAIREGTEAANVVRRQRGWPEVKVEEWELPPTYDPVTCNLTWAFRQSSAEGPSVNYDTRVLGRRGVMTVKLVIESQLLSRAKPTVKGLISGIEFNPGERYAEFRAGDKVAQYGLTALIAGGTVGVAAKTGLLARLAAFLVKGGKGLLVILAGLGGLLGWRRKQSKAKPT